MAKKRPAAKTAKTKAIRRSKKPPREIVVDSLVARCITLVDEQNRPRLWAQYIAGPNKNDGCTSLQFLDLQHRPLLELLVQEGEGTCIRICSPDGHTLVSLGSRDGQGSGLGIYDNLGRPGISLGVSHTDHAGPPGPEPRIDLLDWRQRHGWTPWGGSYQMP
jgi:hypothetical protein